MENRTATVIVEPRLLVREALVSLMESNSHRVICSVGSAADIESSAFRELQPKLVILGALPAGSVAEAASSIRRCWQDVKIIMLFEHVSSMDLQKLLVSGLDACIPMSASPRTLVDALQLVASQQVRVLMVSDSAIVRPSADPSVNDGSKLGGSRIASVMPSLPAVAFGDRVPALSRREEQVLKALARGQSNKVIARACTVTEATVKVHVKSILRKIQVGNRTQAAIWAMQSGYLANAGETMPKGLEAAPA
jgi:two-component system nitrate/nitrite response regulator NarL